MLCGGGAEQRVWMKFYLRRTIVINRDCYKSLKGLEVWA